jgi:hypothetical protein
MSDNESLPNLIYAFRCNHGPLYAFTGDRTGRILPTHIYPQISWRLERCVTLLRHQNPADMKIIRATLNAITKRGFYLTNAGSKIFSLADQKSEEPVLRWTKSTSWRFLDCI